MVEESSPRSHVKAQWAILEESLIISQVHADLVRFETAQNRYKRMCKLMPQVVLRAPLVYIASYLQMTPETLSRVRAMPG